MSVTRTVVPGDWYGVLGTSVIVLLPPAAKSRVAGLWEAVDEGAGFDEVLDAVIRGGLRELPGFVLVSDDGGDVKVVIRGAGRAELTTPEGPVTIAGSADTTWVERNVSGVTGLRVRVADDEGAAYTVGTGLIRVASVEHARGGTAVAEPDADAVAVPMSPPGSQQEEPPHRRRILPPDPALEPQPPAADPDPGPAPPMPPPAAAVPGAPPVPVPEPFGGLPFEPEQDSEAAPEAPLSAEGDGSDIETVGFSPSHLAIEDDPEATGAGVARLIFSSGEVVDVDRAIVIGRAPAAGRVSPEEELLLVTVPSPHHEISSTHLEVRPGTGADEGSAVVTDLGSTNGTVLVQPGRPAEDLRPGIAVQMTPGATIDLGEGVTIQVERGRSHST
jgi:hypothetical protein